MIITVRLSDDLGRLLGDRASREGRAPEEYVTHLIQRDASGIPLDQGTAPSDSEFERLLGELSTRPELPRLPANFSRADVYADHD